MKITVVGGGSYLWSFGFQRQFIHAESMKGIELCLTDVNAEALDLLHRAGQAANKQAGSPIRITKTTDPDEALAGASFVLVAISTGGLKTMANDLAIPEKYGILHTVGDTVGPGGWSRAVRNVPVFHDLGRRMSKLCPQAWMINVSNPLTPLTRTPDKFFGIRTIGMCPGIHEHAKDLARVAGAKEGARVDYIATGIDHGSFITRIHAEGVGDVLAKLKEMGYYRSDDKLPGKVANADPLAEVAHVRADFALWRELGYMPGIGDRHMIENFSFFTAGRAAGSPLEYGIKRTSVAERQQRYEHMRTQIEAAVADPQSKVGGLGHGDDPVVEVIDSLCGRRTVLMGANFANIGQIPGVPDRAVVETRCLFDAAGVHPLVSPMPDSLKAFLLPAILRQEMVVDIAIDGTIDQLVGLMASDPLCAHMKLTDVRAMTKELLAANATYVANKRLLEN